MAEMAEKESMARHCVKVTPSEVPSAVNEGAAILKGTNDYFYEAKARRLNHAVRFSPHPRHHQMVSKSRD